MMPVAEDRAGDASIPDSILEDAKSKYERDIIDIRE